MGILNVSIAIAYGEGAKRAFSRLLQEVLNSSSSYGVADMFNWASDKRSHISSLLPSTLQGYFHRSSNLDIWQKPVESIMLTHLGLRVTIVLMPAISIKNSTESRYDPFGDYHAITDIPIHPIYLKAKAWEKIGRSYSVLDARISDRDDWNEEKNWFQLTLGVLNIGDGGKGGIMAPKHCLAVGLRSLQDSPEKVPTEAPITFTLNKKGSPDEGASGYYIERNELERHGMRLVTMLL